MKPNNVVFDIHSDWNDLYTITPSSHGYGSKIEINENVNVSLVDFGLSEKYIIESDEDPIGTFTHARHIKFEKINRTLGNKFFMSLNQLKKYGTINFRT